MTILRTDTVSGIGTEGTVLEGNITIDSLNYMTLPKGTTSQRYSLEGRDPDYHKLKLHLPLVHHTQFDDYSPASPSITANYDSHISSLSGVFENSAALFSRQGANDWIAISDSTDNDLGSDDFTIECWFMCTAGGTNGYLVQKGTASGNWSYFIQFREATDSINFYGTSDGTNFDIVNGTSFGSTAILPNKWYHVAVCRSGNTFSYYINGKKGSTTDTSSASFHNSSVDVRIPESGGFGATEKVFLQDVRLYKGVAKYNETFTPQKLAEDGAIRYNTDSNKIECYNGMKWMNIAVSSPDLGGNGGAADPTGNSADQSSGARGIWGGGNATPGPIHADIEYINISTQGNSIDFGSNISEGKRRCSGFGSRTRGFIAGGRTPTNRSTIDFVTFSSTGTTTAWGTNLNTVGTTDNSGFANSTRGVTKSGYQNPGATGTLDLLTMSSTGDVNDFGDLIANGDAGAACASPTRGLLAGGYEPANDNTITFVTISTTGNAKDFGDLSIGRYSLASCSNSTRGLFAGGARRSPATVDADMAIMDFVQIATKGNAVEFGDLSVGRATLSGVSDPTRGVWGGGYSPSSTDVIDYIAFASQGNAVDFGNLSVRSGGKGGSASNGHGGL